MKSNLLFTTALVSAAFIAPAVCSAHQYVGPMEELTITDDQSSLGDFDTQGGAVLSSGKLTVGNNVTFENNQGLVGGALSIVDATDTNTIGNNVSFIGNTSKQQGGALHNQRAKTVIGDNVLFENNTASADGNFGAGGAIYQDTDGVAASLTIGANAVFRNNTAGLGSGGAIYNYSAGSESSDIELGDGAVFENNSASKNGGAIANHAGNVSLGDDAVLTGNHSDGNGGAVYNDSFNKDATLTFGDNVTFSDNSANGQGGAIYNNDLLNLGNATFENNKANGKLNDIHNDGTISVADGATVSLDGGITGTNGTLEMGNQSTLNVKETTGIENKVTAAGDDGFDVNVKVASGSTGFNLHDIFSNSSTYDSLFGENGKANLNMQNGLFDFIEGSEDGEYKVKAKAASEVAAGLGVTKPEADTVLAAVVGSSDDKTFREISSALDDMAQDSGDYSAELSRAADALGADAAPLMRTRETMLHNMIFDAATDALSGSSANTIAEQEITDNLYRKVKLWVKGLFNHADRENTHDGRGFDIETAGVALGVDKQVNDTTRLGVGYAYNKSDVNGYTRDTDIDTHTAFVYGKYQPKKWYLTGVAAYSWSTYDEKKSVLGYDAKAKYDVDTFALQGMYGYEMKGKKAFFTPEAGVRYLRIAQDSYINKLGVKVDDRNTDVLTAVAGFKLGRNFEVCKNCITVRPELRAALTYDLMADSNASAVNLPNGVVYRLNGDKLDRLGYELGARLVADIKSKVQLSVGYEGKLREDYQDHTGIVTLQYNF